MSREVAVLPRDTGHVAKLKTKSEVKADTAETAALPHVIQLLGTPPLTAGEKLQDYNIFLLELAKELRPKSLTEWLMVDEVAQLKWIIRRLRLAEVKLVDKPHTYINPQRTVSYVARTLDEDIDCLERSSKLIM